MSKLARIEADNFFLDVDSDQRFRSLFSGVDFYICSVTGDIEFKIWKKLRAGNLSKFDFYYHFPEEDYLQYINVTESQAKVLQELFIEEAEVLSENRCWIAFDGIGYMYGPRDSKTRVIREILNEWRDDKHLVG